MFNTKFGENLYSRQGVEPEFDQGDNEVNLPDGKGDPWIERLGGDVEYFLLSSYH